MDVVERWIHKHGRPANWYSDRHSIFRAEESVAGYDQKQSVATQFSRALEAMEIGLILAGSPQAKGRIERLWNTAQDRLVHELRLADARTIEQANDVLEKTFVPWFNRRCTHKPASATDAHRPIGKLDLKSILCPHHERVVMNDYTVRFENRVYQLHPPVWPGLRKGKVTIQERAEGTMKIWFKGKYLSFDEVAIQESTESLDAESVGRATGDGTSMSQESDAATCLGLRPKPRSLTHGLIPVIKQNREVRQANSPIDHSTGPITVNQADKRSGRTPTLPCPLDGRSCGSSKTAWRPASTHPWR
jgi:hypothetical protein